MHFDSSQELPLSLDESEQQDSYGDTDSAVNTIFDRRKYRDKDTDEEDKYFKWRDSPELVYSVWWCD